ncbi:MAG: NAD(P)H-dependent oxidoreductase [Planctomycetes bacterium]|nr:NAD(P)H-dependent oxidoreductase [Planctomycetota bacterium]MCB9910967.1 NAD(P)H-dependent oxidoreductase [Planctomycetota bacterium]MCB9911566.1 NAD(P)H-dependent oxidoreductase [Planctomycetota bacterium]HPF13243.1 NAD(P)H-dependent oxidoreductase [Planctomycetota bacterium]HRV81627.1 NAD(P)H-dependent oxidoreductase [Planctomycetota bacterium]
MPDDSNPWLDAGPVEDFAASEVREVTLGAKKLAITHRNGVFGAISNACNHAGGPLGQGRLDGDFVVCPWHNWKFHRVHGTGEPGFEADAVPCHEVRVQDGHLWVRAVARTQRNRLPHEPHPLARPVKREPGGIRVLGISTTAQDPKNPRYSTSQALLEVSLQQAKDVLGCETQLIKLSDLQFRACEGYYSKSARACTWPCSITQMDASDQLTPVYEALVHWADVVLVATPIRWGQASSLYFKMAERLNCVQNQITIHDRVLIQNKVASFIITGGQDNIQGVAGQLLTFFTELGFHVPQFPFIAHSRGWTAEDMEQNIAAVQNSAELREGAAALAARAVDLATTLVERALPGGKTERGGRKAHRLEVEKDH